LAFYVRRRRTFSAPCHVQADIQHAGYQRGNDDNDERVPLHDDSLR